MIPKRRRENIKWKEMRDIRQGMRQEQRKKNTKESNTKGRQR